MSSLSIFGARVGAIDQKLMKLRFLEREPVNSTSKDVSLRGNSIMVVDRRARIEGDALAIFACVTRQCLLNASFSSSLLDLRLDENLRTIDDSRVAPKFMIIILIV